MTSIYTLSDPRDPENVRYVGKTVNSLKKRLKTHCADFRNSDHKTNWVKKLKRLNLKPVIIPIAMCKSEEDAKICEIQCIKQFIDWGYNLTNSTDGGEGPQGYKHTLETKSKLSMIKTGNKNWLGKKHSEETIQKLSTRKLGKNNPFFGKKHTLTALNKMSLARRGENNPNFGKQHSLETRAKISEAAKQRWAKK